MAACDEGRSCLGRGHNEHVWPMPPPQSAAASVQSFDARAVSNSLHAMAALKQHQPALVKVLLKRSERLLDRCGCC